MLYKWQTCEWVGTWQTQVAHWPWLPHIATQWPSVAHASSSVVCGKRVIVTWCCCLPLAVRLANCGNVLVATACQYWTWSNYNYGYYIHYRVSLKLRTDSFTNLNLDNILPDSAWQCGHLGLQLLQSLNWTLFTTLIYTQ